MIMILIIFLLSGLVEHTSSIQCYTCNEMGHHCPLPLNLDGGDESNENEIETYNYDPGFLCMSDHSLNPRTGTEKLILRGIDHCEEINAPNHRVHCCNTNHCNKQLPPMTVRTLADIMGDAMEMNSNGQRYNPSIILLSFAVFLQYFY